MRHTHIRLLAAALCGTAAWAGLAADAFTVRAWAGFTEKTDLSGTYHLLFKGDRSAQPPRIEYCLSLHDGVPEFKFLDAKGVWKGFVTEFPDTMHVIPGADIPLSQVPRLTKAEPWHQLVGVFDCGQARLYVDGRLALETKSGLTAPPTCADDEMLVGVGQNGSGDSDFRFRAGEIRYPSCEPRALTSEEVAALYAKELATLRDVKPAAAFAYPEPPIAGELPKTKAYFAARAAKPPRARGTNCVSKIVTVNGVPRISVDGEIVSGMAMMPSPHVGPDAVTFSCRDFAAAGVRLFSNIFWGAEPANKWWLGEGRYDWDYYDARLKAMIDAAPDGWVFPRIKMDPPPWWKKTHPEEYYGKQIRADSKKWKALRERMLTDVITHIETSPLAPHVVGYHIGALSGTEWLIFDSKLDKEIARMNRADRLALYDRRSKAAADALLESAAFVKKLVNRRKIVGSFFGYSFIEQRDAARVYASDDLDFFAAPHSYGHRRGGASGRNNVFCTSSCRLHNKIFWTESDDRTLYAKTAEGYRCETMDETLNVLKRSIGYTLTEGLETWWFLLVGNETFHDEQIMDVIAKGQREAVGHGLSAPVRTESDVAIFRRVQEFDYGPKAPDGQLSYAYGYGNFCQRFPKTGVSYDAYMFEDILATNLPDYKVYVFNDAKTFSSAERAAIDRLVKRPGKTAVWLNAEKAGDERASGGWRTVNFVRPPSSAALREVFASAGAHVWIDSDDVLAAGRGYVMLHAARAGVKRLRFPDMVDAVEVFGAAPDLKGVTFVEEKLKKGETRIYRYRQTPRVERDWKMFDRRLGMFVHWGIYSVGGWHEQHQWRRSLKRPEYNAFMKGFTAENFSADKLVDVAQSAGAEYIVFTSKHHDGFCMWDTATTDFKVTNTPARRDIIAELAAACRRRGVKLGFYFSNPDWHAPFANNAKSSHQIPMEPGDAPDLERYKAYVEAQVTELLTRYGEICCFFWDIPTRIACPEMDALVRRLQPGILIDDRGWGNRRTCDYSTPERDWKGGANGRYVEACDSVGVQSWGYRANEDYHTTGYLTRSIDSFLARGANFLLNVGPRPDGTVPDEARARMAAVGAWYAKVRDSYRNVTHVPELSGKGRYANPKEVTRRGDTLFVHFPQGLDATGIDLAPLAVLPERAVVLNTGAALKTELELFPWDALQRKNARTLHVRGIPADALANESVVLRLDFPDGALDRPDALLRPPKGK